MRLFEDAVRDSSVVQDDNFKSAMELIKSVGGGLDLQISNIMYRPTPYGIQLVLTDPVA